MRIKADYQNVFGAFNAELFRIRSKSFQWNSAYRAYERYFEEGGKTYHHILDPATGKPAESDLISVTIVSNNGTEADCLSTALFVLGKEKAIAYWKEHSTEFNFILVDEENHIYISEGIENHFESSYDYEEVKK